MKTTTSPKKSKADVLSIIDDVLDLLENDDMMDDFEISSGTSSTSPAQ
jgi:hypothetical protein